MPINRSPIRRCRAAETQMQRIYEHPPAFLSTSNAPTSTRHAVSRELMMEPYASASDSASSFASAPPAIGQIATEEAPVPFPAPRALEVTTDVRERSRAPSVRSGRSTASTMRRIRQAELEAEERLAEIQLEELWIQAMLIRRRLAVDVATIREETDRQSLCAARRCRPVDKRLAEAYFHRGSQMMGRKSANWNANAFLERRMKLRDIPIYSKVAGGRAIELAAKNATCPEQFTFPLPLARNRDCNFSFSGMKDSLLQKLLDKETEHGVKGDEVIPEVNDLCASFQTALTEHLIHRTDRAIAFCEEKYELSKSNRNIVVSGGVACNDFIFTSLQALGSRRGYEVHHPPPKVCTDNGVMIAWNGVEKLQRNCDIFRDIDLKDIDPKAPLGQDIINEVIEANLPIKVTRIRRLYYPT